MYVVTALKLYRTHSVPLSEAEQGMEQVSEVTEWGTTF